MPKPRKKRYLCPTEDGDRQQPQMRKSSVRFSVFWMRFSFPFLAIICALALFPLDASAADPKEVAGAILFRDRGCTHCHGAAGEGTHKGPSLANVRKSMSPEQMTNQIWDGGQNMPPFSDSLSHDEVSQLVSFLRAKHRPVVPPAPVSQSLSNPVQ
jgi:mono/diheme cytochrome c family protein